MMDSSFVGAVMPLVRVKEKGQVTLPAKLRARHGLEVGRYLEIREEGGRIVLIPQDVAPRHPEMDAALAEALEDVRAGRVTPAFKNVDEYKAWRRSPEGKKFADS
jgi:AbrB family looped-hinge helix DNA binding protein